MNMYTNIFHSLHITFTAAKARQNNSYSIGKLTIRHSPIIELGQNLAQLK